MCIFETGPSNPEIFLTWYYFLRFFIFPINAVLLSDAVRCVLLHRWRCHIMDTSDTGL